MGKFPGVGTHELCKCPGVGTKKGGVGAAGMYSSPRKYPYSPYRRDIGISWGVVGSIRPKNLKKCMKLDWNFPRGGEGRVLEKIPSMGEV